MASSTLTVRLPDRLYAQLRNRAEQANRTLEAELIDLLATAMPGEGEVLDRLDLELAGLEHFDEEALLRAAQSHLAKGMARRAWRNCIANGNGRGFPRQRRKRSPS